MITKRYVKFLKQRVLIELRHFRNSANFPFNQGWGTYLLSRAA